MSVNVHERLFKQKAMINKMIMDGARDPKKVAERLQELVHVPVLDQNVYQRLLNLWFAVVGIIDTDEEIRRLSGVLQLIIDEPAVTKNHIRRSKRR